MNVYESFNLENEMKLRGRKENGYIKFAEKADGSSICLPIVMAIGEEDGPIILADACTHGDEIEGAEGIIETWKKLDPHEMKGAFVGIPVLNPEAFVAVDRSGKLDFVPQDMNRIFPGQLNGTVTHQIARYYIEEFVKKVDGVVTLHGGGNNLDLMPVTLYQHYGDSISETSEHMARAMGFQGLWQNNVCDEKNGVLDEIGYLCGVPVVTAEIGGQVNRRKYRSTDPARISEGICNILRYFGILDGKVKEKEPLYHIEMAYITNKKGGLHKPEKSCGDMVKEGDRLSVITDIFGNIIEEVIAPFDGVVMGIWTTPVCQPYNWVYMLGKSVEEK